MNRSWKLAGILGVLSSFFVGRQVLAANATEESLITSLLMSYSVHARPSVEVVNVSLSFSLDSITEMDEREQVVHLGGYLDVHWTDQRLQWNVEEWPGIETISLASDAVWKPDFALINSAGDMYNSAYYSSYYKLRVDSGGRITWSHHGDMAVRCSLDLTYYPFDSQTCFLRFENWVYQTNQVRIYPLGETVNLDAFAGSGEWNVSNTSAVGVDIVYLDGTVYTDVYFYLTLTRKAWFYLLNSIVPCLVMSALTCMVFLLPGEAGEKVALTITLLLSFVLLLVDLSNKLPQTSDYTPLLSKFLTCVTIISALSLLSTIYVIRISHGTREVPSWVQRVVIEKIGWWLRVVPRKLGHEEPPRPSSNQMKLEIHDFCGPEDREQNTANTNHLDDKGKAEQTLNDIFKLLKDMQHEKSVADSIENSRHTWMTVGLVVDRILLCAFVLVTVTASAVIMTLMPQHE